MTLKAFAKERVEKAEPFPSDMFGLYIGEKATIKKKELRKIIDATFSLSSEKNSLRDQPQSLKHQCE